MKKYLLYYSDYCDLYTLGRCNILCKKKLDGINKRAITRISDPGSGN